MRIKTTAFSLVSGFAFGSALVFGLSTGDAAEAAGEVNPIVVELFTSQGCSSCPPADAFLEELAADPQVVAITRPVTYWDRLGWKDTLARVANTDLQKAYAARGGEGAGVYTPQTMVQGRFGAVGSDRTRVLDQIGTARKSLSAAIAIRSNVIAIAGQGAPANVKLVALKSSRIVRIGSGENGGRVVRYSNIVVDEKIIGTWRGGPQTFARPVSMVPGADKYAIIVQSGNGPILAGRLL